MKKFISLILAVLMLVSVVPVNSIAAEQWWMPLTSYVSIGDPFGCTCYIHNGNHKGQDFPAYGGTTVRASKSGTVVAVVTYCKGSHLNGSCSCGSSWGNYVKIKHSDGFYSLYAHLSSVSVSNGQSVSQGQKVGGVGTTGDSTGNHLHFEVYNTSNTRVNPMNYINPNNPSPSNEPTTILYPTSGSIVKFASGVGNNMYLDFACTNTNVQIYENCDGHSDQTFVNSQYFKLTHVGDGWYTIVGILNGGALDVLGENPSSGTNICQSTLHGKDNQLYRFYDAGDGYCYIKSKLGTYVDVANGDNVNNTNVWAYSFNGSNAQKWKLIEKSVPVVDTEKPIITGITVTDVDSSGYTVNCSFTDNVGVTKVEFPTWTDYNHQDDLVWYQGNITGNNASVRIEVKNHNYEYGDYMTHIYVYDASGNYCTGHTDFINVPEYETEKPSISNVRVTDVNESGFTISCNVSDNVGIKEVIFPAWTSEALAPTSRPEPGQDDIIYHKATISGNTATCRINIADHNNSYGEYFCDPHVYDTSGNMIISGRVVINVPKFVAHCEGLAPLYTYDVSKNDSIEISIWAFNLTGDEVDCYYQIDNGQLVYMERGSRPDVVDVHPECKQVDCGFGLRLDATTFSEGTHNIKILAKSNGAEQYLFENNFVVVKPTFTASFNANGGSCSTSTKSVKCGNTYGNLPTPTRAGYTLDGWYTALNGGTKVTASTKVTATSNHTLYAHWTCNHSSTEVRNAKTATCTAEGYTGDTYCNNCGVKTKTGTTIAKKAHTEVVDNAVSATCSKTGLTEGKHCSVCNTVTVTQQIVATVSHIDNNTDYKCDYGCGYTFEIPDDLTPDELEENTKNCSCNCHKGGISGLIWKILRFFYKLFKINPVCGCGVAHY